MHISMISKRILLSNDILDLVTLEKDWHTFNNLSMYAYQPLYGIFFSHRIQNIEDI